MQYIKSFLPARPTLAFREGVFKLKLVVPVKLRVIQVVFVGEVVFVFQPHFQTKLCVGGG